MNLGLTGKIATGQGSDAAGRRWNAEHGGSSRGVFGGAPSMTEKRHQAAFEAKENKPRDDPPYGQYRFRLVSITSDQVSMPPVMFWTLSNPWLRSQSVVFRLRPPW